MNRYCALQQNRQIRRLVPTPVNDQFAGHQTAPRVSTARTSTHTAEGSLAIITLLSGTAWLVSAYLAFAVFTSSKVLGCSGDGLFQCDHVLGSRWATVMGLPVPFLAIALHSTTLVAGCMASTATSSAMRKWGWRILAVAALSAALTGVWFIGLQAMVLGKLCIYCLIAHACGIGMAIVLLASRRLSAKSWVGATAVAMVATSALIAGQLFSAPPQSFQLEEYSPRGAPAQSQPGDSPTGETIPVDQGKKIFQPPRASEERAPPQTPESDLRQSGARRTMNRDRIPHGLGGLVALVDVRRLLTLSSGLIFTMQESGQEKLQESKTETEKQSTLATFTNAQTRETISLDTREWPRIGDADAPYVCIELFDYTCPHCRRTEQAIRGAAEKLGGKLTLVVLPVPLNRRCNSAVQTTDVKHAEACEIAELSIAVWRVDPAKFREYHEWLMQGESAPSFAAARQQAGEAVGEDRLNAELGKPTAKQFIEKHVQIYRTVGGGVVPIFLFPRSKLSGEISSAEQLTAIVKQQLEARGAR